VKRQKCSWTAAGNMQSSRSTPIGSQQPTHNVCSARWHSGRQTRLRGCTYCMMSHCMVHIWVPRTNWCMLPGKTAYLDLCPAVPAGTLGDELPPSGKVTGNTSDFTMSATATDTHFLHFFYKCIPPNDQHADCSFSVSRTLPFLRLTGTLIVPWAPLRSLISV